MPGVWHSATAALILAASLALKLALHGVSAEEDLNASAEEFARSLTLRHYAVERPRIDLPSVQARLGNCGFSARLLDPFGLYRDTELRKVPQGWRVAYTWRSRLTTSLPRFGPLAEYYSIRMLARLGRKVSRAPVIMLSIPPDCALPEPAELDVRVSLRRVLS